MPDRSPAHDGPVPHLDDGGAHFDGSGAISLTAKGKPRRQGDGDVQKALGQVERDISRFEGRLNDLSDALAVASIDKDVEAIARLGEEYERTQQELEDAYARWEGVTRSVEAPV